MRCRMVVTAETDPRKIKTQMKFQATVFNVDERFISVVVKWRSHWSDWLTNQTYGATDWPQNGWAKTRQLWEERAELWDEQEKVNPIYSGKYTLNVAPWPG
jgi:hypothetical protein